MAESLQKLERIINKLTVLCEDKKKEEPNITGKSSWRMLS